MKRWTIDQERAIHAPAEVLVSAAAGAGKTAVLSERIARLVAEGADIKRMLVVTFTDAAAQEMKQRVERSLLARAEETGDPRLREQAEATASGNISTLHSFCLYLLRRNFHILGLDPAFRIADDAERAALFQESLEEATEAALLRKEEGEGELDAAGYRRLIRAFRGEERVFAHARQLHTFLMARPDPWGWLDSAAARYDPDAAELDALYSERARGARSAIADCIAREISIRARIPAACTGAAAVIDDDLGQLRARLTLADPWPAPILWARFSGWPKGVEPTLHKALMDARTAAHKKLREQAVLSDPEADRALLERLRPVAEALSAYLQAADALFLKKKRSRSLVDFSDMEHLALALLEQEENGVAAGLRSRFSAIFVDEYQDSSPMQEALIARIANENRFLVGDVKQSIYGFREADPGLFLEKLKSWNVIHLNENFRSAPAILEGVNAVFSRIMQEETAGLRYDEMAALHPPAGAANTELSGIELLLLTKDAEPLAEEEAERDPNADTAEEDIRDPEAEARAAGFAIRRLMETGRTKSGKALRYADIAVLLRSHRHAAEIWARTFAEMGIPAYAQITGGYFDAIEVQVFLNLLRVLLNRREDVPLLSVLRAMGGFSDAELAELRGFSEGAMVDCLLAAAEEEGALPDKARQFLSRIDTYRREARLLPLPAFLSYLLEDTGFLAAVSALPSGHQREANLLALLERAKSLGAAELAGFLRYMDQAKSTADLGRAQAGGADVVRILSMHRSKGLEFPVVILGGLGRGFFAGERGGEKLALDGALGLGFAIGEGGIRVESPYYAAIREKNRRAQLAEEMRILYVAMTRAEERLILIGSGSGKLREEAKEAPLEDASWPGRARSFLEWLLAIAARERARFPVSVVPRSELLLGAREPGPDLPPDAAFLAALRRNFAWEYPHAAATRLPSKASVSALLRGLRKEAWPARAEARLAPPEEGEDPMLAAERGTALHRILAELPLLLCPEEGILPWIERTLPGAEEAPIVARFLESELGRRVRRAVRLERELSFSLPMPAAEALGEGAEEPILLQGVIDCCFLEEGAWVLLDYKTDRVARAEAPARAKAHAPQLALYAKALEGITRIPVRERVVVFLRAGVWVRCT